MGTTIFSIVENMLGSTNSQKLNKLSDLETLKRKCKCYDALSHYFAVDSRALVGTASTLYKVTRSRLAVGVLGCYILLRSPSFESAMLALDAEVSMLLLDGIAEIDRVPGKSKALDGEMVDELMDCSIII